MVVLQYYNIPERIADKKWQFGKISAAQIVVFVGVLPLFFGVTFGLTYAFSTNLIGSLAAGGVSIPFALFIGFARHSKSRYPLYKHLLLWLKSKFRYNNYGKTDETIVKFSTYNIKGRKKVDPEQFNELSEVVRNADGSYSEITPDLNQVTTVNEAGRWDNNILQLKDLANNTIYLAAFKVGEIPLSMQTSDQIATRINDLHKFFKTFRIPFSLIKINQPINLLEHQMHLQSLLDGKNAIQQEILRFDLQYSQSIENQRAFSIDNWYVLFFATKKIKVENLLADQKNLIGFIHTDLQILTKSQIKNVVTAVYSPWVRFDDERLDQNDEIADLNPLFKFSQSRFEKDHFAFRIDLASILKDFELLKTSLEPEEWEAQNLDQEYFYNISTLDKYPNHNSIQNGWLQTFSGLAYAVIVNCVPADPRTLQRELRHARDAAQALIKQQKDETQKRAAYFLYDSYDQLTTLVAQGDEILFNTKIFFISMGHTKAALDANISALQSRMKPFNFTLDLQFYQQDKMVHNIFPQTTYTLGPIQIPMPALSLAYSFPFGEKSYNDPNGIALGFTQNDKSDAEAQKGLFSFDLFSKARPNANQFVIGTSGGGKSTYLKKLILHSWARGINIVAIDPENEYSEMCQQLGTKNEQGQLVSGAINIDVSETPINPLEIHDILEKPNNQFVFDIDTKASWLSEWLGQIIFFENKDDKKNANPSLDPALVARTKIVLQTYLVLLYESQNLHTVPNALEYQVKWPTISDLIEFIKENIKLSQNFLDHEIEDSLEEKKFLLKSLNFIFGDQAIGKPKNLWSGATSANLPNLSNFSLINFNISGLSGLDKGLQAAVYALMLDFAKKQMQNNRTRNKKTLALNPELAKKEPYPNKIIFVVDEAHLLMANQNYNTLGFLIEIVKRIRKYGGSIILATQNVQDFVGQNQTSEASKIIDNCATSVTFKLAPNDLAKFNQMLGNTALNETQQTFLSRAQPGEGLFLLSATNRRKIQIDIDQDLMFQKYLKIISTTKFIEHEHHVD